MGQGEDCPPNRGVLYKLIAGAAVAIGLGFLLVFTTPPIPRGAYRIGLFLGLAAFAAIIFGPSGSWDSRMMGHTPTRPTLIVFIFVGMSPYLLLLESGISGYRGFTSWMRYLSLVPAVLGGVGLAAAFLLPRLLRR